VERFVEKPEARLASELLASGALWNSFLFAARGAGLLARYECRFPGLLARFRAAFQERGTERAARLAQLYDDIEPADFSRDLVQGAEGDLRLVSVPACGWTDLGTPERVAACLEGLSARARVRRAPAAPGPRAALDLADALRAMRGLGAPMGAPA
jgi:mannose-1-phosphate guanylyltransferase